MEEIITLSEAARRLGRPKNQRLIKSMVKIHKIQTVRVGNGDVIDKAGFLRLQAIIRDWDSRPRPGRRTAAASA